MRETLDIPDHLHRTVNELAITTGRSFEQSVLALMERGLAAITAQARSDRRPFLAVHPLTGLPLTRSRRPVDACDIASLSDS